MKQMVSFAAGAVIAGTVVWSRVTGREATVRDVEYGRGYDDGHAVGWIDGREHGRAERPAAVRSLDSAYEAGMARCRAHHPATFAERN